ncbi:hypothetical protein K431DRAFT_280153 [Polychaeton citri CBS 116435]|uniref:CENP-V/GFA domain-containing protein n=1 Tax=Polychaeton citri CBS 116435 TaxID=1314669 RepID=A0A9P4QF52_9PEZI|nr:hypothetical protein K431DRAFT_280153 [Polychaeton citri CBS 116435]
MSGCLCVTSIPLSSDEIYRPAGELLANLSSYEFSKDRIKHYFCSTCGTHMLAHVIPRAPKESQGRWYAMCGTLEVAESIYWPRHEYVEDTLDSGCASFLPSMNGRSIERWAQHPNKYQQLQLHWVMHDRLEIKPLPCAKLHAYCKCGGVDFWIRRPANRTKYLAKLCACDSCRLANGMEMLASATACVDTRQISLDEAGKTPFPVGLEFATLKTRCSSPDVVRGFCATCGASVFNHVKGEDTVDVAVGLLDVHEGARAESWLDWKSIDLKFQEDGLRRAKELTLAVVRGLDAFQRWQMGL